jgi:hypothetical protein
LFADPANKSRSGWHNTGEREKIFSETYEFRVVNLRGTMGALKVITARVLALEMASTGRGTKGKANVICNVGGLSLSPNMAIILLVHAVQRLGPGLRWWDLGGRTFLLPGIEPRRRRHWTIGRGGLDIDGTEVGEGTEKEWEGVTFDAEGNKWGESWPDTSSCWTGTSSIEESDKSITLSTPGSVLTLMIGGVLKAAVEDQRGVRISVETPIW